MARTAVQPREGDLASFTPLLEGSQGLRSRALPNGRRVYNGVTIIRAGLGNARDRNYYPVSTLEGAVKAKRFDGLRAYADHPDSVSEEIQPERTVRDLVGVYKNSRFVREGRYGGRVVADLHLLRSAKWLSDTVDDLMELGEGDKIGLSINGRGKTVEKRLPLEESGGDEQDVNWVEDFLVLRSADVVTEAGAGGTFLAQLLESARGAARTHMNAKQKRQLAEAFNANDTATLGRLLKECGCTMADAAACAKDAKPAKESKSGKAAKETKAPAKKGRQTTEAEEARRRKAAQEADDAEEDDVLEEGDEGDEAEEDDDELDTAVDELTQEADESLDGEDGAEDLEEDGDDEGDEGDEDGDDEEAAEGDDVEESEDDDVAPAARRSGHPLASAADRVRAAAATKKTREAASIIPPGKKGGVKGPSNGKTAVNIIGTRRKQGRGQKGRRYSESGSGQEQLAIALRRNDKLTRENARLSAALRVRQTADRARNLLRESAIPEKLQPELLRSMVGKSEEEMRRTIRYHEKLVESVTREVAGGDFYAGVEGAGARVRESNGSGSDSGLDSLFSEVGLPMRDEE